MRRSYEGRRVERRDEAPINAAFMAASTLYPKRRRQRTAPSRMEREEEDEKNKEEEEDRHSMKEVYSQQKLDWLQMMKMGVKTTRRSRL